MLINIIGIRGFSPSFKGSSGIDNYIFNTVTQLEQSRFKVFEYNRYKNHSKAAGYKINTCFIHSIPLRGIESFFVSFQASILSCFDSSKIIWYQGLGPAFFSFIPKLFGKKIVTTIHGLDWKRKKWNWLEKLFFLFFSMVSIFVSDQLITVSKRDADNIQKNFNKKSKIAYPGKSIFVVGRKPSTNTAMYIGRIVPEKRVEWILKAVMEINKNANKSKRITVIIAGSESDSPTYYRQLKKNFSADYIIWAGHVTHLQKYNLFSRSHAYVSSSEIEGFSISLVEAISNNIVSLVSDATLDRSFYKSNNIITFTNDSFTDFKLKFKQVMNLHFDENDPIFKNLSWKKTAESYSKIFYNLMS